MAKADSSTSEWFGVDDSGKRVALPVKSWAQDMGQLLSSEKRSNPRKTMKANSLSRLVLKPSDWEEPEPRSKIRKIENTAKKSLFKKPNTKSRTNIVKVKAPSIMKIPSIQITPTSNNTDKNEFCSTPLLDVDETEEALIHNKLRPFPFKSPKGIPNFKFSRENLQFNEPITPKRTASQSIPCTPDSNVSLLEFMANERLCQESPISSVCQMFQNANIHSVKKKRITTQINTLRRMFEIDKSEWEKYKTARDERFKKMENIFQILETENEEKDLEKENQQDDSPNTTRRSNRLAQKTVDLRRKTLTKNLQSSLTPRHGLFE